MDKTLTELSKLKSKETKTKWDHKTVPYLIQFVTVGNNGAKHADYELLDYIEPYNCILTTRAYKHFPSADEDAEIVRKARNLPEGTNVHILFANHPRYFISYVFDAWKAAYDSKKPSRLKKVDEVLQMIEKFDPRRGETLQEHQDWGWH